MYSRFLEEAGHPLARLAADSAERWSDLAASFLAASRQDQPESRLWRAIGAAADRVVEAEERLWTSLAS
jgi:hypothetical protein